MVSTPPPVGPPVRSGAAPGRLLAGRYRLKSPLARGGMAEVWEGTDEVLGRAVAVKVLQSHLSGDAKFVERFRREAVTAARLTHPGIVATYDTGMDGDTAWIVMELVEGRTLRQLIDGSGPLDVGLSVVIAAQIADALAHAHRAGLVHRDIKPANVLVCDDDLHGARVKVTDFGIAKARAGLGADLTQTGTVLGTPKYLSPEQIEGSDDVDERSDLYSFGVVLFEMLAGSAPFQGPTDMAIALAHLHEPPPPVASLRPGVPAALDALVAALLAKRPDDRPASPAEVGRVLERITPPGVDPPVPPRRRTAADGRPAEAHRAPATEAVTPTPHGPPGGGRQAPAASPAGLSRAKRRVPPETRRSPPPARRPRRRRRRNAAGLTVGGVAVAAVAVGGALLASTGGPARSGGSNPPATGSGRVAIQSVAVYLDVGGHPADDPAGTRFAFDGNPATSWYTDQYGPHDPSHFGGLYDGEGLAIHLARTASLAALTVTSSTRGWAASTYVAGRRVATGAPLAGWGTPTATRHGIDGSATFDLGGRRGAWVLLWLTDIGPGGRANVAELQVRAGR